MDSIIEASSKIPSEVWTALGTALIAFFGVWLTNLNNRQSLKIQLEHNEKLQRQRHSREQLEELYILYSDWSDSVLEASYLLTRVRQGSIGYKDYLATLVKHPKPDHGRMGMIAHIHGGSLERAYHSAVGAISKLTSVEEGYREVYKNGLSVSKENETLTNLQDALIQKCAEFRVEIAKAAREA